MLMARLSSFFVLTAIVAISCVKENPVADLVTGGSCGSDGARMQATVAASDWCANATVSAVGSGTSAILTGVSLTGGTIVLNIDSLALGDQPINEAANGLLFTSLEGSFTVPQDGHGTLSVTSYDPTSGRLKGTADIGLRLNGEGTTKHILASFDVTVGSH
jgi:hypothetical protein